MFPARFQSFARRMAEIAVAPFVRLGITPDVLTVAGLFLTAGVAAVAATGHLRAAGVLLLLVSGFDMLDGALARVTSQMTKFGAFLDSVLDRYSEAIVVLGLLYVEYNVRNGVAVMLLVAMLTGSFLISYTRARAEGLGLECKVGILPRPERIIILAIGLLFHQLVPILILLVVLTNLTTLQRIWHVWSLLKAPQRSAGRSSEPARIAVPTPIDNDA